MCVIIEKPAGVELDDVSIRYAKTSNPDGFGYMYYSEKAKRIVIAKSLKTTPEEDIKIFKKLKDVTAAFHYRIKTHGPVSQGLCHPFRILDKEIHGMDMFLMHNGIISNVKPSAEESDTVAFARMLKPILEKNPLLIETEEFQLMLSDFIGRGNKLLFMYDTGKIVKINENEGSDYKGCWVSNTRFTPTPTKHDYSMYYYGYDDYDGYKREYTPSSHNLFGAPITVGQRVYVLNQNDKSFFEEGVVSSSLSNYSFSVKFKGVSGVEIDRSFDTDSGSSFASSTIGTKETGEFYYVLPSSFFFDVLQEEKEEEEEDPLKTNTEDEKKEIKEFDDDCDNGINDLITPYTMYGGKTIIDFFNEEDEDIIDFVRNNPYQTAEMLTDLVEFVVISDETLWEE